MSQVGTLEGILHFKDDRSDAQLRDPLHPLRPVSGGIFVSRQLIKELNLRPGLLVKGQPKGRHLTRLHSVEGLAPREYAERTHIYEGIAVDPQPVMKLEHDPAELTTRMIDILTPIGFGQRGLIVAPPRTGKTILLQNIAKGIHHNYPDAELCLLLIDERPEEVTDMRRNIPGTVYASSNDNDIDKHLDLAQLVIERCKRKVEFGKNVIVLLDSLTRLGRAFNAGGVQGGRTMSGGLDNRALEIPKKLFGAARKIENGGSLTILASCLIDTGSRMDQIIFEEFKGTGNMELTLDRKLANQRIFPALNILQSGTRKEEKLLDPKSLAAAHNIRKHLLNMTPEQGIKSLQDLMKKCENVRDFHVAESEAGVFLGCGALHLYGPHLAEVRSIVVKPEAKGQGAGGRLLRALLEEAEEQGVVSVCLFTRIPDFFFHFGFRVADRTTLPDKIYKDCQACPRLYACDEVAMVRGPLPKIAVLGPTRIAKQELVKLQEGHIAHPAEEAAQDSPSVPANQNEK